ncbi:S8 family serine peptidase [Polaribacter sp. Z014]|uniref:S8 family peptidase n=1 Tax=Polaribacter sp. Z014 TaxID=2927126 RepID=UPI0020202056|nr:S8 family serine peptidase [Polaribacter sp. Z014]MCL7765044.1 S8 family serine peptidase [Polaribacter sp. Z014]
MQKEEFEFQKFGKSSSILPFIIAALVILTAVFLLRNCNSPNEFWNGTNPNYAHRKPVFPEKPNLLIPIDTLKIIVRPDDPLKRPIISNLLNVYVQDTTDLKVFSQNVISNYIKDSLKVTYYADAYKRVQFEVPPSRRIGLKAQIKQDFSLVKFVCYESILTSSQTKTDPGFNNPNYDWFYSQIGLFKAWNQTMGDPSIKIAVIDDSFDPNHKELINQIEKPWNVFEYSNKISSYNNKMIHGTHVAGTVVGEINNGIGISGVAPRCKLIPIQIADHKGMMTTSSILDGIFYALKNDADIINMSLGMNLSYAFGNLTEEQQEAYAKTIYIDEAEMWNEVYEIAEKEGAIIVQAAGNSSVVSDLDPMKRSKVSIIVGATDRNEKKAQFSNYGEGVDIYAPGVDIYSSIPNQQFKLMDGTSMASPIISGCVALIKSIDRDISLEEIKKLMKETGKKVNGTNNKLIQINQLLLKMKAL